MNEWIKNILQNARQEKLITFLLAVFAALFATAVFVVVADFDSKTAIKWLGYDEKQEVLIFIGWLKGGILLAIGAIFAHRRAAALEKNAEAQTRNNELTEIGHRQERFKTAIEHLGNDKMSVRMGGGYEMVLLAKENRDLRETIFKILCSHIRQTTTAENYPGKTRPTEEIQSLLDLLFRQTEDIFAGLRANLQRSFLVGADLFEAVMQGVDLNYAWLQGVNLDFAKLDSAVMHNAQLQGANLPYAQLGGVNLHSAQLQGANLLHANLLEAYLPYSQFQGANILGAIFDNEKFSDTNFAGVSFDEFYSTFRETIEWNIDKQVELPADQFPDQSGIITTPYTREEAKKWMDGYEKAMAGLDGSEN